MKKAIFMLAVGAMALTACSETEVIEEGVQSPAIGFNTNVGKNSRAIDNDNFAQFFVYSSYKKATTGTVQVFNGTSVTKTDNKWGYTDTRYWIDGATYNFAAYGVEAGVLPGASAIANYSGGQDLNLGHLELDGQYQKDIVYASEKDYLAAAENNKTISFGFKHIVSRLNFTFKSGLPKGYKAEISKVRLSNVRNTGRYQGSVGKWDQVLRTSEATENQRDVADIAMEFEKNAIGTVDGADNVEIKSGYAYVIPYKYANKDVRIIFDVKIINEVGDAVVVRENMSAAWAPNWAIGTSYAYNITINGEAAGLQPIEFAGSIDEDDNWDTDQVPDNPEFIIDPGLKY